MSKPILKVLNEALVYGATLKDLDTYDFNELINFTEVRAKHEQDLIFTMWRMLRWHAYIILKGFSKKGLSESDLILPDEVKQKADKADPEHQKKIDEWFEKMDNDIKKKHG